MKVEVPSLLFRSWCNQAVEACLFRTLFSLSSKWFPFPPQDIDYEANFVSSFLDLFPRQDIINGIWVKQTIIFPFFSVNLFSPQQDVMNGIWINWMILVPFFFGRFFPPGPDVMNGIWVKWVIRLFGACQDQLRSGRHQIHCS